MNRAWYNKGRAAARRSNDMYAAWHAAKGKPGDSATNGRRITAQDSFFSGFQDAKSGYRESGGSFSNFARRNPTKAQKRPNKLQRLLASTKRAKQNRVSVALSKFLKQANPGKKYAGCKMQRNVGGSITIIPIKLRRAK